MRSERPAGGSGASLARAATVSHSSATEVHLQAVVEHRIDEGALDRVGVEHVGIGHRGGRGLTWPARRTGVAAPRPARRHRGADGLGDLLQRRLRLLHGSDRPASTRARPAANRARCRLPVALHVHHRPDDALIHVGDLDVEEDAVAVEHEAARARHARAPSRRPARTARASCRPLRRRAARPGRARLPCTESVCGGAARRASRPGACDEGGHRQRHDHDANRIPFFTIAPPDNQVSTSRVAYRCSADPHDSDPRAPAAAARLSKLVPCSCRYAASSRSKSVRRRRFHVAVHLRI